MVSQSHALSCWNMNYSSEQVNHHIIRLGSYMNLMLQFHSENYEPKAEEKIGLDWSGIQRIGHPIWFVIVRNPRWKPPGENGVRKWWAKMVRESRKRVKGESKSIEKELSRKKKWREKIVSQSWERKYKKKKRMGQCSEKVERKNMGVRVLSERMRENRVRKYNEKVEKESNWETKWRKKGERYLRDSWVKKHRELLLSFTTPL